jgi:protein SCO1/2
MRFCVLSFHEAGMIKTSPAKDHPSEHRLALPQRAEEGAEGRGVRRWTYVAMLVIVTVVSGTVAPLRVAATEAVLPRIGAAPEFTLTTQENKRLSLRDLRGKVVAVTFIYASCADTCPLLTAKLVGLQSRLGPDFGSRVAFLAVTVDPDRDTPAVLTRYAYDHGAQTAGWAFLTGTRAEIGQVARRYGVYYRKTPRGDVDHTFLTSLVDQKGILRVQYLGVRFDPEELLRDLQSLVREGGQG